ncbi:MAG: hypothetical protein JOY66_15055 [Acetobacteraceae bacterium]|nr:hypothetical protein [Acetobacteraceae bacterium]
MSHCAAIGHLPVARQPFHLSRYTDPVLRPGIEAMAGLLAYYAGADEATSSLSNVSVWASLEAARQMDAFQPMLDLGKSFAAKGATFERPIMNYATLWQLRASAVPGAPTA